VREDGSDIDFVRTSFLQLFLKLFQIGKRQIADVYIVLQSERKLTMCEVCFWHCDTAHQMAVFNNIRPL